MDGKMARDTPFALGTFSTDGIRRYVGVVLEGELVTPLEALAPLAGEFGYELSEVQSTLTLLERWEETYPILQAVVNRLDVRSSGPTRYATAAQHHMESLRVHAPVTPRQIFLSGANYFQHVVDMIVDLGPGKTPGTEGMSSAQLRRHAEALMTRRRAQGSPYIFTKPVSVLSGAFDSIVIPPDTKQPDWEIELGVIIGRAARHVSKADALHYVAGYTIVNDITNRDQIWVRGDMQAMGTDWFTSKCRPTYLPCGPVIVPAAFVPDPQNLRLTLRLNGEVKQDESTRDMIFDVAQLIEHLSGLLELQPGDLICTGSPAGNGTHFNRYLQPGDVVSATITGLGEQSTPVVAERNPAT
jgi:2-keto-4-pentenoate hydratase/2-oxohepta-3-ene-1,7-dioic acid hydratase in catechol pathway